MSTAHLGALRKRNPDRVIQYRSAWVMGRQQGTSNADANRRSRTDIGRLAQQLCAAILPNSGCAKSGNRRRGLLHARCLSPASPDAPLDLPHDPSPLPPERERMKKRLSILAACLFALSLRADAADWPQWRGPDRTDV